MRCLADQAQKVGPRIVTFEEKFSSVSAFRAKDLCSLDLDSKHPPRYLWRGLCRAAITSLVISLRNIQSTYNQRNSLFLLYGTEEDIGVDHDAVEVTVVPWDTLHGTGTGYEGLSRGRAGGGSGHLRTEGWARGLIGWNLLSKVFL